MYLTAEAVATTLAAVGGRAAGSELVMEDALPPRLRDETGQAYAGFALPVAAERGEPWLSFFNPERLAALLDAHGLTVTDRSASGTPSRPPSGTGPTRSALSTCAGWPGRSSRRDRQEGSRRTSWPGRGSAGMEPRRPAW